MALRDSLGEDIDGDGRLYAFQRAGVKFLTLVKRAILDDEMGTGKTVQTILALQGAARGRSAMTSRSWWSAPTP